MIRVKARLPVQPKVSVAVMVKLNVPDCVGEPFKLPPDESVIPMGNVPADTANE